ncbi:MAG: hypothetical protein M1830_000078 [Pleopsidium flavum]|nr:MAG: hypothetical protein M1830_000078 [Pleopsidium flavum]
MSTPSTPLRRSCDSAAPTPSTGSHGSTSCQLTPRSKVRAMLAAIDDDSDVETNAIGIKDPETSNNTVRRGSGHSLGDAPAGSEGRGSSDHGGDDADDEEAIPVVPKGRMAARMLAKKGKEVEAEGSTVGNEEAYERIKKQLMEGTKVTNGTVTEQRRRRDSSAEASSEEGEPINNAATRRRRIRALAPKGHQGSRKSSPLVLQRSSPSLSMSPGPESPLKETQSLAAGSESDLPYDPHANSRFLALVARKREERLAKEEADSRKKAEREAHLKAQYKNVRHPRGSSPMAVSEDDSDDNAVGRRLTQQARPTRKASKKALEEMNRETQRMSRNMQLAHQAKTKKKITKESFFAKFNFKPGGGVAPDTSKAASSSATASSAPVSDFEGLQQRETPPTSPAYPDNFLGKNGEGDRVPILASTEPADEMDMDMDEELPTMEDVMTQPLTRVDKGKGKAAESRPMEKSPTPLIYKKTTFTQPPIRIHPPKHPMEPSNEDPDSDSDLEIITKPAPRPKKTDIFDRLPAEKATDARSLLTLRALANLTSPGKQTSKIKASMTPSEMQTCLRRRARQQAAQERAEKLQQLRDRGIIIQTAEERQRDQAEVEDLVEKARREAEDIMKKERDAARKDRKDTGKCDGLENTSDEEDEDYRDDNVEEEEVEFSGSGQEEVDGSGGDADGDEDVEEDDEEEEGVTMNEASRKVDAFIDQEASDDGEEGEDRDDAASEEDEEQLLTMHNRRKSKNARVIDDDDDNEEITADQPHGLTRSAQRPFIPGLPMSDDVPLGLTQAFAATMADSQTQDDDDTKADSLDQEQDSLAFLHGMPEPNFPVFDIPLAQDSQDIVKDSQSSQPQSRVQASQEASMPQEIDLHYSQSQIRYDSMLDTQHIPTATQYSELPDPSQDVGFAISPPLGDRFLDAPPSTVDTVLLSNNGEEASPIVKRKGRLRRKAEAIPILSDVEDSAPPVAEDDFEIPANIFDVMRKAAKKPAPVIDDFDKKRSEAKGMVEEQAEESEDEYAGLGGASDDESGGEEDEDVKKMMDESDVKVDERKLAAFYADKERASDAKAVEKLFKDMNSGMLRRKRGADFDLSDSDDDGEARRRMKRREFAKMRKALLEDENIGKIAENPKKLAFLRAIEDREKDDDLDFLNQPEESSQAVQDSQEGGDSRPQPAPSIQSKRKRPLEESFPDGANRPPPPLRRPQKSKKPSTLAEIRESVSFLIEEPNAVTQPQILESSDIEDGEDHQQSSKDPFASRRRTNPIIDRISLKRAESATTPASGTTKLAFHNPSIGLAPGFRVPSLLRRATTQITNIDSHGITAGTERMAGGDAGDVIKRGGTKKSSINYFARELERSRVVREGERKRMEGRKRVAGERRGILGGLAGGKFD